MKHSRKKKNTELVTRVIVYRDKRNPQRQPQEIRVDIRRDEVVTTDYAAATVAVRTGTPLDAVRIIEVRDRQGDQHL